ncbi:VP3 [Kummerowia striata gokushovirus]|nr:VP3 [Kummerowia striata gokushovirus]
MSNFRLRRRVTAKSPEVEAKLRTRQEPKDQCDVNKIVANAKRGIAPSWLARGEPVYMDFSEMPKDLTEAYMQVQRAEEAFMSLPSEVRTALDNDPRSLEGWLVDPANREMAVKHGLVHQKMAESEAEAAPPRQPAPKGKKSGGKPPVEGASGDDAEA